MPIPGFWLAAVAIVVLSIWCLRVAGAGVKALGLGTRVQRMLLVIAHPDDECMFFVPALAAARQRGVAVHLLCLSTGNFDGLGPVRSEELRRSARNLGIPAERVTCVDDPALQVRRCLRVQSGHTLITPQDGMKEVWPPETGAKYVAQALAAIGKDDTMVLTFDEGGVSGHPNHIGARNAVRHLAASGGLGRHGAWELETTGIVRKYIGLLDLPVSAALTFLRGGRSALVVNTSPLTVHRSMVAHASQYVWYRRLFVVFSRYTFMNTLQRVDGRGA